MFGLTILKEASVVDGHLVPLPRLLGLLAVRLQRHLHLGGEQVRGQFYLKSFTISPPAARPSHHQLLWL